MGFPPDRPVFPGGVCEYAIRTRGRKIVCDAQLAMCLILETGAPPFQICARIEADVRVERLVTKRETSGSGKDRRTRLDYEIIAENDKMNPIAFELSHPLGAQGTLDFIYRYAMYLAYEG